MYRGIEYIQTIEVQSIEYRGVGAYICKKCVGGCTVQRYRVHIEVQSIEVQSIEYRGIEVQRYRGIEVQSIEVQSIEVQSIEYRSIEVQTAVYHYTLICTRQSTYRGIEPPEQIKEKNTKDSLDWGSHLTDFLAVSLKNSFWIPFQRLLLCSHYPSLLHILRQRWEKLINSKK